MCASVRGMCSTELSLFTRFGVSCTMMHSTIRKSTYMYHMHTLHLCCRDASASHTVLSMQVPIYLQLVLQKRRKHMAWAESVGMANK